MEYTDLKFSMPHINCTNFKEKDTLVIRNIIKGARLGDMISFSNYGNISFSNELDLEFSIASKRLFTDLSPKPSNLIRSCL